MRVSSAPKAAGQLFLVLAIAVLAIAAAGQSGLASASVARTAAYASTPQCQAKPGCGDIGLYNPSGPPLHVLQATGQNFRASIGLGLNDSSSVGEDFTYIDLGTVGAYDSQAIPNALGLTAFDFAHYGSAFLFQVEFSPAGIQSGLCLTSDGTAMILRRCEGSPSQTFFRTSDVLGTWAAPATSNYVLSVLQVRTTAHHLAATGWPADCRRIVFAPVAASASQYWTAVPSS
jgi:hypothetical protein